VPTAAGPRRGASGVIPDGAVVIIHGTVEETGPFAAIAPKYPGAGIIGDGTQLLMPGLVDAHSHGRGLSPMNYVKLGRTGLEVSRICLGCMSYGGGNQGNHAWSLGEERSRPFIKRALEAGINFFDTANRYSLGSSEEILGRAIKDFARRDEVVIATKVYGRMRPGPNGAGLSRKAIMVEIDASLSRLGTDYVDLYQIHRWDHETPIEETLEALHDVVKAGKARYIGASSMHAWQFARALGIAERNGWIRFVSMQNLVNLLYREEEREMLPLCSAEGIGVIPWSPQARGKLTRDWNYTSIRTETDEAFTRLFAKSEEADRKVVDRVAEVAKARGIPRARVALAWLLAKPVITAPIVGATKLHHLDDALASVNVKLSADEITSLEELYVPHEVVGFV
jgi:aryl-alcohol dehydrogenase-like predicted oxidoreductase